MSAAALSGSDLAQWALAAVTITFLLADLAIVLLWFLGYGRERPLLAPRWSVADIILGLQAVLAGIIAGSVPFFVLVEILAGIRHRHHLDGTPLWLKYGLMLLPLMLIQQAALILVPLLVVRWKYRLPANEAALELGLRGGALPWRRAVLLGLAAAVVVLPLSAGLETGVQWALAHHWIPLESALREMSRDADAVTYIAEIRRSPVAMAIAFLLIGLLAPVAEEVFFRGFAYRALRERFGVTAGILLSGLLFAAIHGNPLALLPLWAIGALLAVLRERTGSLLAPIALHCANNSLAILALLLSK